MLDQVKLPFPTEILMSLDFFVKTVAPQEIMGSCIYTTSHINVRKIYLLCDLNIHQYFYTFVSVKIIEISLEGINYVIATYTKTL
jgi:hypothetical protein